MSALADTRTDAFTGTFGPGRGGGRAGGPLEDDTLAVLAAFRGERASGRRFAARLVRLLDGTYPLLVLYLDERPFGYLVDNGLYIIREHYVRQAGGERWGADLGAVRAELETMARADERAVGWCTLPDLLRLAADAQTRR